MRFASFVRSGRPSWGILADSEIIDLGSALGARAPTLRAALALDDFSGAARSAMQTAPRHPRADISLEPVIPDAGKILCVGLNYETHRKETGRSEVANPTIFTRFADTQIGDGMPIVCPRVSKDLDFEGELAVIIGRPGRYIPSQEAMAHVAGFACYNDVSVRDWQRHTHQFTPGKNFPATGPFGPCMVTPDEVGPLADLRIVTRLNGVTVQEAKLGDMIFDIPRIIEYCSSFTPLAPGDVIAAGTPGGVGAKRVPPLWMKPGDTVEVEIDRVGLLKNGIVAEGGGQ
jgi:2-keto-4-pentenoate hydratase/2-oxohepta-3-ene-1,7-dioic acid hydratase in catechol pathway